ncbi:MULTISPECIES: DUF899 domain-containing protein [Bacillus]|uniref:Thioredoxin n=2 Tax=Bacillus TaxID=1386 RepID=A0A0M3R9C5_9BACI|nr:MULTISPECIES: DUF899 domain-containing protein [Bacillus]ALC81202.1 hypothetical protein AM592_06030 [Bacillus gobiensis]MBP1080186.1 putative dithiol-disulfide oxidoreductase (DUF899 family) [Bacillus capparidis]MED1094060.1 DUF899 domain-containing protein [Bacillus capparidis]
MKKTQNHLQLPNVVSRDEWLVARKELLAKEKEFTKARDSLNAERRRLPMVEIDKDYVLGGPNGKTRLLDLFEGRPQLIVHHFMFAPDWEAGCPACSLAADNIGHLAHLHARNTSLALVSRAPLSKLQRYKERMGWNIPWYSSYGSDFNYDFHVTLDESVAPIEYNYLTKDELVQKGVPIDSGQSMEVPGVSTFLRDGERIFHTYTTYARGTDPLLGIFNYLDLTALGRQEDWEQPPGRSDGNGKTWLRRHDEYDHSEESDSCCHSRNDDL